MAELQTGDIVDITIKGVRVHEQDEHGCVTVLAEAHEIPEELNEAQLDGPAQFLMPPQAAVERVSPDQWPPRTGDLWRDRDGDVWLCRTWEDGGIDHFGLVCARRIQGKAALLGGSLSCGRVLREFGPLTLVHREEA